VRAAPERAPRAETTAKTVEQAFKDFCQREDIGIILISQSVRPCAREHAQRA